MAGNKVNQVLRKWLTCWDDLNVRMVQTALKFCLNHLFKLQFDIVKVRKQIV